MLGGYDLGSAVTSRWRFSSLTSLFLGGWRLLSSEDSEIKDAAEKPAQRKEGGIGR